jgi:tRNA pseudouridine38-40 synthase
MPTQRYKATIAYDGSGFHGWQKQEPPGLEPLRTVQGVVEATLIRLLGQPVNLIGASRTDAGVHANGQVAQFDADTPIPIERLADAINSRLPDDAEVRYVEPAPPGFHVISDVMSKQYRYRLFNTTHRPLWLRHVVYHCWVPLDTDHMAEAAGRLEGTHDFAGFAAAGHGRESTVRTVHRCWVEPHPPEVHVLIEGDGFLYNMVRIIAGTLVEVGRGRFEPDVIDRVLTTADRAGAGPTLPPTGLCLEWIRYD